MIKILIADDEALEREALRRTISAHFGEAVQIETASNGYAAVTQAEVFGADIALMDIEMPGIDGLTAAQMIHGTNPGCRMVILTAYQQFQYAQEAITIGAVDYLLKPVSDDDLFNTIGRAIEEIRRQRSEAARRSFFDQFAREQFVLSAVSGYANEAALRQQLKALGISFQFGFFLVFRAAPDAGIDVECLLSTVSPWFYLLQDVCCLCYAYDDRLLTVAIVEGEYRPINEIESIVNQIAKSTNGLRLRVGIGSIVGTPGELQASFEEANDTLARCTEQNPVLTQRNKEPGAFQSKSLERKLYQFLLDKDIEGAAHCVETTLDALMFALPPDIVHRNTIRLLQRLAKLLEADARTTIDVETALKPLSSEHISQQELFIGVRTLLLSWMQAMESQPDARVQQIRREIDRYINEHFTEDLSIGKIARAMHYSEPYFSKLFTHCFQCNFVSYLTDIRLRAARNVLFASDTNIKEVGAMVGYADPNYFSKVFRKAYGVSPSDYRKLFWGRSETEGSL